MMTHSWRMSGDVARVGLVAAIALAAMTTVARATTFSVDADNMLVLDVPSGSYHVRQPMWTPEETGRCDLAVQAYLVGGRDGFSGFAQFADVPARMSTGDALPSAQIPRADWTKSTSAANARLWHAAWYSSGKDAALLYDSNGKRTARGVQYVSDTFSIWLGDNQVAEVVGEDLTTPSHVQGSPLILCQVGREGTPVDIGAFQLDGRPVMRLTSTPSMDERQPAQGPGMDIVAFTETSRQDAGAGLNVMKLTRGTDGTFTGKKYYTDPSQARAELGNVLAFAWSPRVLEDASRGDYGMLAYYTVRSLPADPKDVRVELWVVPVSVSGRVLSGHALRVSPAIAYDRQVNPAPPAWHPDGEHLFFLGFDPGSNPAYVAHVPPELHFSEGQGTVEVESLPLWPNGSEPLINVSLSCSPDGAYLAVIATGKANDTQNPYYDHAYVMSLRSTR